MTMRCAVLGDPIDHSLSPVLHRAGYAAVGLDWTYEALRVPTGGLAEFLGSLDHSWRGLSLTMPLKREVLALVPEASARAKLAGAANTVVIDGTQRRLDNTDLPGAAAALRERYDGPVQKVSVLGAGATAASVGLALCDLGATMLTLHARDVVRAADTVAALGRHPTAPRVDVVPLEQPPRGDVLVSTVPATAQDAALLQGCTAMPVVFEVVYDPWPTPLARATSQSGRLLIGGLDLLVHQAALQFRLFTGHEAPLAAMRGAGEQALADRSRG